MNPESAVVPRYWRSLWGDLVHRDRIVPRHGLTLLQAEILVLQYDTIFF